MSVRKLTTKLTMLLILVAGGVNASAKEHEPLLVDPFAFDPDFQWFEPVYDADILDMKPKKRAHTGWFATYDRINLYGSRPRQNDELNDENKLDEGGGHRYDVGFMRPDEETGMLFTYLENFAGAGDTVRVDRLNRLNEADLEGEPLFALGPNRFGLPVFPEDSNVIGFSRRFYDVGLTLNAMDLKSFELSKTWRLEPYHYGGILEPMLGVRFIRAEDSASLRTYGRTAEDVDQAVIGLGVSPYVIQLPQADLPLERLQEDMAMVDNQIYTLQAGFRYFKFQDRFRYSAEFRGFTGINLQCFQTNRTTTTTIYDGFDIGSEVVSNIAVRNALQYQTDEAFLIGFDARAELGYQLTKMINVRCGVQVIDLATGIWRSGRELQEPNNGGLLTPALNTGDRDQHYLAFGYTFGIELNR
jgi:hypothetical protein